MSDRALRSLVLTAALVLTASAPGAAGEIAVRLHGAYVSPSAAFRVGGENSDHVDATVDDGAGIVAGLEYRPHRRFGLEASAFHGSLDTTLSLAPESLGRHQATDRLTVLSWMLGANFHLTPERGFDLYLGPRLASNRYGSLTFDYPDIAFHSHYEIRDEQTLGGYLGVDVPRGSWSFGAGLLYLPATARPKEVDAKLRLDLTAATVGVGYRFGAAR